jgi:hypothetical protein
MSRWQFSYKKYTDWLAARKGREVSSWHECEVPSRRVDFRLRRKSSHAADIAEGPSLTRTEPRPGLSISISMGHDGQPRNCRPYCGVALLLVRSADGGCHVLR